jgi:hypothetical protein
MGRRGTPTSTVAIRNDCSTSKPVSLTCAFGRWRTIQPEAPVGVLGAPLNNTHRRTHSLAARHPTKN